MSIHSVSDDSDNETNPTYPTVGWGHCPAEILFIIFEKLDITSLRCCLSVSRWWKEAADHICGIHNLWQELAEDGIVNYGVTQMSKSLLSWRDLFFNSLLWRNIKLATVKKTQGLRKDNIKNIHVYKDNLIVVNTDNVEYFNVESFKCVRVISLSCEDFQECDDMMLVVTNNNNSHYKLTFFAKLHNNEHFENIQNHFNGVPFNGVCEMVRCWRWLMNKDCCYIIDWKHVMWKIYKVNGFWKFISLARYYGGFQYSMENTMNIIHIQQDEVFVSLKWGDLIQIHKYSFEFRKQIMDIPTYVIPGKTVKRRLPYKEGSDKFSALVNAPFGIGYVGHYLGRKKIHFHYDDPEMSCSLQHGEVVFLGYEDGRVEIRLLKKCFQIAKKFNVKYFDKDPVVDPAVTGLDVCEVKNMHWVFVKTNRKLYQVLIKYPDSVLVS